MKTTKLVLLLLLLLLIPAAELHAEGGEIAVLITGVTTVVIVMGLLFVMFVLNADIGPFTRLLATLRRSYWAGSYTTKPVDTHHSFDGITELDNGPPPWFTYLFYGTVVFGVVYFLHFHVLGGTLQTEEYAQQMDEAAIERRIAMASEGTIDESALVKLTDAASLESGAGNFGRYCVTCHAKDGGGIIGPNLTDQYWIHGGTVQNVYATIKNGVPAKGMISWQLVFTPKQIQQLASYVLSLQGTNPLNGKKAEGTLYVPPPDTTVKR